MVVVSWPSARRRRASAEPLATASMQPALPQAQTSSGCWPARDVADVAGGALRAALEPPAGDDAGADAGGDLDVDEVGERGPRRAVLADGHDVDVVVDEDGDAGQRIGEVSGDRDAAPPGHDGRLDGAAGGELDGPGHADADADDLVGAEAELGELGEKSIAHPRQDDARALGDRPLGDALGEHLAGEIGDREAIVVGAEVGGEDDAAGAVEAQARGGPAAGGGGVAFLGDEAEREERADAEGDGRAGEPRGARDLGARELALADHLEDVPGRERTSKASVIAGGQGADRRVHEEGSVMFVCLSDEV